MGALNSADVARVADDAARTTLCAGNLPAACTEGERVLFIRSKEKPTACSCTKDECAPTFVKVDGECLQPQ